MTPTLRIELEVRPFERAPAELVTAGFFADERPLRGAAGRADWRLCGLVSDLLASGHLRGRPGEALLVPSFGTLQAPRVLLMGLGERAGFDVSRVYAATRALVARAFQLGVRELALAPPGVEPDDFPRHAGSVLEAALEAAREEGSELVLRLLVRESEAARALQALEAAQSAELADEVSLVLAPLASIRGSAPESERERAAAPTGGAARARPLTGTPPPPRST